MGPWPWGIRSGRFQRRIYLRWCIYKRGENLYSMRKRSIYQWPFVARWVERSNFRNQCIGARRGPSNCIRRRKAKKVNTLGEDPPKKGFLGFRFRHLMIVGILLTLLLIGLYYFTIQSDAYQEAEHFALTSPEIARITGPVSKVSLKFWSGFDVIYSGSGGAASFVFSLKGEKEESVLDVRMTRTANSWTVVEAYLTTKSQKGIPIKQKPGTSNTYLNPCLKSANQCGRLIV